MLSGHSRMAFVLAKKIQEEVDGRAIVITSKGSPKDIRLHKGRLKKEGLAGVKTIRPFFSLNEFIFRRKESKREIFIEAKDVDLLHTFDFSALFFLKNLFSQHFPFPVVCSLASFPKIRISDLRMIGIFGILRVFNDPRLFLSLILPNFIIKRTLGMPDWIITTSPSLVKFLTSLGISSKKIFLIPPFVDVKKFKSKSKYKIFGSPLYLYYGWASDIRGLTDVVSAFEKIYKKLPNARLIIAPREIVDLESRLIIEKIKKKPIAKRIVFKEFEKDVSKLLASVDAVILPFRSRFGFAQPPMTVLETMAAGKPVITTQLGNSGIIKNGENGLLVPPRDINALFQKMLLIKAEPERIKKIGINAQKTIEKKFSYQKTMARMFKTYKEVINEWNKEKMTTGWHKYRAQKVYSQRTTGTGYDKERFTSYGGKLFDQVEKQVVLNSAPKNQRVDILEAGTGTGRFAITLTQKGYRVLATDVSEPLLKTAKQKIDNLGLSSKIKLEKADIYKLPYKDNSFGFVYAIRVINQIWNNFHKREAILELSRVVKPEGILLFDIVNKHSLAYFKAPKILITISEAKGILKEAGFKEIKVTGRLTFSQTLLEKLPPILAFSVSKFDTAFSNFFPFFATRVYFKCENRV